MSIPTLLEKQILATITYYDILDYPLTGFEVFLYLITDCHCEESRRFGTTKQSQDDKRKYLDTGLPRNILSDDRQNISRNDSMSLSEVIKLLNTSEYLKKYIGQKWGFYFVKKVSLPKTSKNVILSLSKDPVEEKSVLFDEILRQVQHDKNSNPDILRRSNIDIIQQRLDRKKLADQKWKKIKKIFWLMQIIPFMKMVLVSGSLALGNSRKESDIDLIIIAKKGRIWTARTLVTLLTSVLGARRHKDKTENKICLNHYITDKSLQIPFESLYNAQSYVHLINVYDSKEDNKLFQEFQENNRWIKKYVKNYKLSKSTGFRSIKRSKITGFIAKIFEFILSGSIGNFIENKLSLMQSKRIKKDPLCQKMGGRITVNDNQLEFHPDSHEANIIPEFNKRMQELGLFEFSGQKDSGLIA